MTNVQTGRGPVSGVGRLARAVRKFGWRPERTGCADGTYGRDVGAPTDIPDCQQPDAPPDLPTTHGLQLASIEARLIKLESQVTNQNRLLLIGILAIVGDLAQKLLKP